MPDQKGRIAILDLGTNTFNLVIAEKGKQGEPVFIYKKELPVELGKGGIHKSHITAEAAERAVKALHAHRKSIGEFGVDSDYAFATSAVRDAANGREFAERIRIETGIEIKIITGDEEAQWIYEGVKHASVLSEKTSVIMDIGGGSTEFIIADRSNISWKRSYPLGVSRLFEMFRPENPISAASQSEIFKHCELVLEDFFAAAAGLQPIELIGSSGSFESFAQMILCRKNISEMPENGFDIDLEEFEKLHSDILASTLEQRLKMRGLLEMRANAFGFSVMLTGLVLKRLALRKMTLSLYSLKEGIAGHYLQ
ncbi:MAG: phosphatase [Bacteroidia bacterium]|jgi:exopolyphosphatase/guanosine-5'-triphosphate,3'-diphosphate pyrophosphatase|nr:phosphatase [Bacteroidia bacterium]